MQYKALEYLYQQLREKRIALGKADKRPGHTEQELLNIMEKIAILEYIIGVVTAKGDE